MNIRSMKFEDYGISDMKYRELKYFCLQYDEKKAKIERGLTSKVDPSERVPGGGFSNHSRTESQAVRNYAYLKDCEMIETACVQTSQMLAPYLLESVTRDTAYEQMKVPCGRTDFYAYRRAFYFNLMNIQDSERD